MTIRLLSAALAMAASLYPQAAPPAAVKKPAVYGSVHDDQNRPVQDALVTISRKLPGNSPGGATGAQVAATRVDSQGRFAIPTLADGDYLACVFTQLPGVLPNCMWRGATDAFTVRNGESPLQELKLATGSRLFVRLNDPSGHLPKAGKGHQPGILAFLTQPTGARVPLGLNSSDAKGRVLEAAVPWDADVDLLVTSGSIALGDEKGKQNERKDVQVKLKHSRSNADSRRPVLVSVTGGK